MNSTNRYTLQRTYAVALAALLLLTPGLGATAAAAQADRPMAMSDVSRLLKAGDSTDQALQAMAERGVRFRVTQSAERQLTKFGFTDQQIAAIKRIAAGEDVQLDPKPDAPDQQPADAEANPADAYPIGYPMPAGWHAAEKQRVLRAMEAAGLGYRRIEFTRFTLYCNDRRAAQLVPILRSLEQQLIARFPASISNATSPDSAHIVIVDGTSEWSNWVDALFASYKQDGITFNFGPDANGPDAFRDMPGFMLGSLVSGNATKRINDESTNRFAAYAVGYLMMGKAGGKEQPDALQSGFGNLTETMAFNDPSVMIYSYVKRDLKQDDAWKTLVAKRFNDRQITSTNQVWGYETASMKPEHYAESWSYVSTLAMAPEKFANAVELIRTQEARATGAFNRTYELEDIKLLEAWYRYATQ